MKYGRLLPLAAVLVDRVSTAAIEGTADQMWSHAVTDRRAEAAAVKGCRSQERRHGFEPVGPASSPLAICSMRGQ